MSVSMRPRGAPLARFPAAPPGSSMALSVTPRSGSDGGYPWHDGELLYAADLNAAITASSASVLDLGAKGDGVTDDTAAIQNALNTFAGNAVVFIPDTGLPYLVQPLNLPSGTNLLINGTLQLKPGVNSGGVGILMATSGSNITIRGHGTLDSNTPAALSAGVNFSNVTNLRISGITIKNARYWNLQIGASTGVRVDKVTMIGGQAANEFSVGCDDCWLTGCYINGPAGDEGFSFYGGVTNSGAIGNTVTNAGDAAFSVLNDSGQTAPCKNIIISDNLCYGCGYGGISVDQGTGGASPHSAITITGNRVYNNNGANGPQCAQIAINEAHGVIISNNMISDASAYGANDATFPCAYGVYTQASVTHATITGNSFFDIGNSARAGFGLYIGQSNYVQASGNSFQDSRSPPYMSAIAGTAGTLSSFTNNLFGNLVAMSELVCQIDTLLANSEFGVWTIGGGQPAAVNLALNATHGYGGSVAYLTGNAARWFVGTDGSAETGSNTGSNFEIVATNDAGGTPVQVLTIGRATGIVTFRLAPSFASLPINAADDAAAASAGVPFLGTYRNGSVLQIRVV